MNFNSLIPKNYVQRDIEIDLLKFLKDREIIVLRGTRQSGKSTLLKKIASILQEKYQENQVMLIDFEDEIEQLKFEKQPKEYVDFYLRGKNKIYLLLDEIQYIKKAGKILKLLFEKYPNIKFIVSGSSTLDVNKLGENLVGRAVFFELYPFSFAEYLKAKDRRFYLEYQSKKIDLEKPRITTSLHLTDLNRHLKEYLTFGGYPRIVLENNRDKKKILLKNLYSTYIEKDIVRLYGMKYKEKAVTLLKYLSATVGNLLNYNDICQSTNSHFLEVKEVISIFKNTYILERILPFQKNLVSELKKNPKVYFIDLGLRNTVIERFEFSEDEWGKIMENYGYLLFKKYPLAFWRTTAKAEVDFVIKDKEIPIEIKGAPKITRSYMSFIQAYRPKIGILANLEKSGMVKRGQTTIFIQPLALL